MAIIPAGEKVLMTSANVNTIYGGSAALKEQNKWYTIEDIGQSLQSSLIIKANGTVGGPLSIPYATTINIGAEPINGTQTFYVKSVGSIQLGNYGIPFTSTFLELPLVTETINFTVQYSNFLKSISCPLMTSGDYLSFTSLLVLETLNFPKLKNITGQGISFGELPNLINLNFPLLEDSIFIVAGSSILQSSGILQSTFPSLRTFGIQYQGVASNVFKVDLPLVTVFKSLSGPIASLYLPNVIEVKGGYLQNSYNTYFTKFILGTVGVTKSWYSTTTIYFNNNALDQASVDNILKVLASLDGTNGTTINSNGNLQLQGGTNAVPSSLGIAAKNILLARGWAISTN